MPPVRALQAFLSEYLLCITLIVFMAGGTLAYHLPLVASAYSAQYLALGSGLFFFLLFIVLPRPSHSILALLFCFWLGFLHTQQALMPPSPKNYLANYIHDKTRATLIGHVITMAEYNGSTSRFHFFCREFLQHNPDQPKMFIPVTETIQLTIKGPPPALLKPGNQLILIASLQPIKQNQTPGVFQYRLFMAARGIYVTGWIDAPAALIQIQPKPISLFDTFRFLPERMRWQISTFFEQQLSNPIKGVYQALLIGSRSQIPQETLQAFKACGVMHILAISGLHLTLLGAFSLSVLRWLCTRSTWLLLHIHVPHLIRWLTLPLLFGYACIAGLNIPALRALTMAVLIYAAILSHRSHSLLHLIALAGFIVLIVNPLMLFMASFQLSFAAVVSLLLITDKLTQLFIIPIQDGNSSPLQKLLAIFLGMFWVALAATLGTLPILLYHFNTISLIGPAMNLIVEPLLCFWSLPLGMLALPFMQVAPDFAQTLLEIGGWGIILSHHLCQYISQNDWVCLHTITPNFLEIITYYLIILTYCTFGLSGKWSKLCLITLSLFLCSSFTLSAWHLPNSASTLISWIDVGQGNATLLQWKKSGPILVDGGGPQSSTFNVGERVIAPYLWQQRIWKLDKIIITHPHKDHYNGLPFIIANFQPNEVIINGDPGKEPAYFELLTKLNQQHIPITIAQSEKCIGKATEGCIRILAPDQQSATMSSASTNNRSIVLHLKEPTLSVLLPADIEHQGEQWLVTHHPSLQADIMLAPHHGSSTSSSPNFMQAVKPKIIIVSAGNNRQGTLPAPSNLRRWRKKKITIFNTATDGTITLQKEAKGLRIKTFTGRECLFSRQTNEITCKTRNLIERGKSSMFSKKF